MIRAHRETRTEWQIKYTFVSCLLFHEWNISLMNEYSKLYEVAVVRSLVYKAQTTVCQVCSLDNTFLYNVLYTPSLLQILHILLPSNTWYHRWNTQFMIYTRRHIISAHHLKSYNFLYKLPSKSSLTNLNTDLIV